MEQTSNNLEHNMTDKVIAEEVKQEEYVNDIENPTNRENNVQVNQEEVIHIGNTTNNEKKLLKKQNKLNPEHRQNQSQNQTHTK